jgi:ribonuclease VapC
MIALDASVLVGLIRGEADVLPLAGLIGGAHGPCLIGGPTLAEALVWCAANIEGGRSALLDGLARAAHLRIVPFDHAMAELAHGAYQRFGKLSGHPAALNFGDALSYATARAMAAPLLFKGSDFGRTDLVLHPASILL